MFAMSEAVMKGFAGGSGPEVVLPASPEQMTKAIQLVEEEEGQCGSDSCRLLIYSAVTLETP